MAPLPRRRHDRGYVLLLTALILIPLLLISAMAVDYGSWYTQGSRMQRATDAAALAGVVWLPDSAAATTVARAHAKANGFDNAQANINVVVTKLNDYELRVVITDTAAKVYLSSFVRNSVTISRAANAKYVLPIPLGSPKNYFGTADFNDASPEGFYAAINGTCQSKYQGDPFAVPYVSSSSTNACSSNANASANTDYIHPDTGNQYEYYITVPPNRSSDIYVDIWNPGANETHTTTSTTNSTSAITTTGTTQPTNTCSGSGSTYTCTTTITLSAASSSTPTTSCNSSSPYTCTSTFTNTSTKTFTTASNSGKPTQGTCTNSGSGSSKTYTCPLTVTTVVTANATPSFSCTLASGKYTCTIASAYTSTTSTTVADPSGTSSTVPRTTYTLYSADSTPLDDSDNPVLSATSCGTSAFPNPFTPGAGFAAGTRTLMGEDGWYDMCVIPAAAPAGKYILAIKNSATDGSLGLNGYAVMASYANNIGGLCDKRTDATCPNVAGKNWISIYANSSGSTATFFLAEIDLQYAGKTLLITLFDPGEGGNNIQILDPLGRPTTFVATDEGVDGTTPGTPLAASTTLDVTNSRYNGRYVQLAIDLPANYGAGLSQYWWQIKYTFTSGVVTDRTTWGVRVLGNPVHLTT